MIDVGHAFDLYAKGSPKITSMRNKRDYQCKFLRQYYRNKGGLCSLNNPITQIIILSTRCSILLSRVDFFFVKS